MSERTLFLAWQDAQTRQWFPIGRLDADVERSTYSFRYIGGAEQAQKEVGFPWLLDFPDPGRYYRSPELFPLFQNRVMARSRPDFADYLRSLDLSLNADPIEILTVNGGYRMTDSYEVFPKLEKGPDGSFDCRFFLHGWRHVDSAKERLDHLMKGEELRVTPEPNNPHDKLAVQLRTMDNQMIGWAPRYLAPDLAMAAAEGGYEARVVRVNHQPIPLRQRFLIEMRGRWENYEPMSSRDYIPLIELGFEDGVGSTRGLALSD